MIEEGRTPADIDEAHLAEVDVLQGSASRARERLGWTPKASLEEMLAEMVEADLARYRARPRTA